MKYKLKLTKGRSYYGNGVKVKSDKPEVTVEKELSDRLVATGRFALLGIDEPNKSDDSGGTGSELKAKPVDKMNNDELVAYAEANDIDIADCKNKQERLDKIQEFIKSDDSGGTGSELNFGV